MSMFFDSASKNSNYLDVDPLSFGVPRAFGDFILKKIEGRDWSLRDLASVYDRDGDVDAVVSYLSRFINGKIRPKPKHIEQLADALRLDGEERERFVLLGMLARGPAEIEEVFLDLQTRVAALERKKS